MTAKREKSITSDGKRGKTLASVKDRSLKVGSDNMEVIGIIYLTLPRQQNVATANVRLFLGNVAEYRHMVRHYFQSCLSSVVGSIL